MINHDDLYRKLQIHLDKQTLGFPELESGADIRLLKQFFSPEQAETAMLLTYRYESIKEIHKRAENSGISAEDMERILDSTAARGVISFRKKNGIKQYRTIPYIFGMAEGVGTNPTPEMISANAEFLSDHTFWIAFLNTKISQLRTIPVEQSIKSKHPIGNYNEIKKLIEETTGPIVIAECGCRTGAAGRGEPCKQTSRTETCMSLGDLAKHLVESGKPGRQISREEAREIMRKNQEDGLVLQPSNSQAPERICSCCGCCCGLLKLHKAIPDPVSHWTTYFHAEVDPEICTGCEACVGRCQVQAMKFDIEKHVPAVDLTRCLGCGLCVPSCPVNAIELKKKDKAVIPPATDEEMMEVIMTNK